jgi:hypothetical protein
MLRSIFPVYDYKELMRCKCFVSEMTHNSCGDCDQMFFPEFKELLDYCNERWKAMYAPDEDEGTELAMGARI